MEVLVARQNFKHPFLTHTKPTIDSDIWKIALCFKLKEAAQSENIALFEGQIYGVTGCRWLGTFFCAGFVSIPWQLPLRHCELAAHWPDAEQTLG